MNYSKRLRGLVTIACVNNGWRITAAALFFAACVFAPIKVNSSSVIPHDPIFSIEGSLDAWSVSHDEVGCFLLSPRRKGSSRLAIGLHPTFGFGLYAVGFAMAVRVADPTAPVLIRAGGRETKKVGRMISNELFFIPLDRAETVVDLKELREAGALWLFIRDTWISHSGKAVAAAIDSYEKVCGGVAG